MSQSNSHDVVVVGCGAIGSAAAYHLSRAGRQVLLLEQFEIGHRRGSSHGGSRIIRYAHDSQQYARQMPATFALWRQLERESGVRLLELTGGLYAGSPKNTFVAGCRQTLDALNFSYTEYDSATARLKFPQIVFPDDWSILFQADSGILAASLCVKIMATQAARLGATIREQTRTEKIVPCRSGVEIHLASAAGSEIIYANQCIITTGAWINRLLNQVYASLPVRITHQQVAYYSVNDPAAFSPDQFPIFVIDAEPHFYGFPIFEQPGHIKIAVEQSQREVDPDAERAVDQSMLRQLGLLIAQHLPSVSQQPVHAEPCIYTETDNRDFVVDRLPDHPQIIVGAGFSGRGFKHAIAIGQLIAELVQTEPDVYSSQFWLDEYRITRFAELPNHAP